MPLESDSTPRGRLPDSRLTIAVLQQLVELEARGSITAVARHFAISQPTVSANLSRLEGIVGFPLMLRGSRGTRLTREGVEIARAAQPLLEAAAQLDRTISALTERDSAPLRIAASLTIAEQLVPRWLADPTIGHVLAPGQAALSVGNSDEVMDWVHTEAADIGFVEGNRIRAGFAHVHVGSDELVVVVGPAHRWFSADHAISASELVHGGLVLRERGSGTLQVLEDALARAGVQLPRALPSFASTSAILTAVRHGGAAAVVSRLTVESDLAEGKLVAVRTPGLDLSRNLTAIWLEDRAQRADAASLISGVAKKWKRDRA